MHAVTAQLSALSDYARGGASERLPRVQTTESYVPTTPGLQLLSRILAC
jgi:hypothetical protein